MYELRQPVSLTVWTSIAQIGNMILGYGLPILLIWATITRIRRGNSMAKPVNTMGIPSNVMLPYIEPPTSEETRIEHWEDHNRAPLSDGLVSAFNQFGDDNLPIPPR